MSYAIICPICKNAYPAVFDCTNCGGYGKTFIPDDDELKRETEPLWTKLLSWLFFGLMLWTGFGLIVNGVPVWLKHLYFTVRSSF